MVGTGGRRSPKPFGGIKLDTRVTITNFSERYAKMITRLSAAMAFAERLQTSFWMTQDWVRAIGPSGDFGAELTEEASIVGPHKLLDEPSAIIEPEYAHEVPDDPCSVRLELSRG
jgi:hypothetical protein